MLNINNTHAISRLKRAGKCKRNKNPFTFVGCATSAISFIHQVITDGGREPIA